MRDYSWPVQVDALRAKALGMLNPKMVKGKVMTGPMLATMLESYVQAINTGATMTITDAWEAVTVMQVERAYEQAKSAFGAALGKNPDTGSPWQLPVAAAALQSAYDKASAAAVQDLERDMLDKNETAVSKLRGEMLSAYRDLCAANEAESSKTYGALLQKLWKPFQAEAQQQPETLGGLDIVLLKWKNVKDDYKQQSSQMGLEPAAAEALADRFLASTVRCATLQPIIWLIAQCCVPRCCQTL
eukprot:COSAG05_NODE_220_length_13701_cov_24.582855_8_plen_244_part_00